MDTPPIKKHLTVGERKKLSQIISGNSNPNSKEARKIIDRPHVAVALEAILDNQHLTDDMLAKRLYDIVVRRPKKNEKTGISNATAVDANAHNVIRTIWQAKGKFVEKKDVKVHGNLSELPEEQLDKIIDSGMSYLKVNKSVIKRIEPVEPVEPVETNNEGIEDAGNKSPSRIVE